ncbi:alpha/beta hydrolase [Arthrobacter sp. Y-9]|uniref:alpha/beta fold hydrolase n=1 Tax=Arthrobacter sp. Y-9 TaxID=3039385 RepID=UPI00241F811A|nr:alpha/beta hydrolase [Arthrobacter sp. Y-9]WFR82570.1 alpha/beta hydrolase [Arthrobacter sp. Y-9]
MTAVRKTIRRNDGTIISLFDQGGEGPTLILLHGLAGSAREFLPTAASLKGRFRVLAVDQRGHGLSTRRPADLTRDAFAQDVVAVIEELAPGQAVVVAGQSMGAHTAFLTAAARPDLIDRLIMLEGHPGGNENPSEAVRIGQFFASWPPVFPNVETAREALGSSELARAWIADLEPISAGWRPRFDADVMQRVIEHVHVPRWKEWEQLKVPTVAIFAENGMFTDGEKDEMIRRRPDTRRVDLPGGGHDAHLDALTQWLSVLDRALTAGIP